LKTLTRCGSTWRTIYVGGGPASIEALPGGVSNRTVQVTWSDGGARILKQALEKLRVKKDWFSSPERIQVEAKALRWLNCLAPPGMTPTFLFFEDVPNHLLAMEAVPEAQENWKSMLLSGRVAPDYFEQFGFLFGTIHRLSSEADPELCDAFPDTGYFESLRL
jgi:Phosphotransferase enzyme family